MVVKCIGSATGHASHHPWTVHFSLNTAAHIPTQMRLRACFSQYTLLFTTFQGAVGHLN
jgi:hypothetical protein